MQALAHLGAAVVDQHRAVLVDVHQRAGLVVGGEVERDPELHRGDGQAPLGVRVRGVEGGDLRLPARDVGAREHLVPRLDDAARVAHRLAVGRRLALDVEVAAPQVRRVEPEQRRAAAEDVLDHQHPLRPAEAAERGLRGLVGAGDPPVQEDVRDPVGVVDVAQRPRQHRLAEVEAPAAVGGEGGLERQQPALVVEADPPLGVEPVALAGHRHVLRAAEPQPHRSPGERGAQRGDRGEAVRLHLLAAERRRPSAGTAP